MCVCMYLILPNTLSLSLSPRLYKNYTKSAARRHSTALSLSRRQWRLLQRATSARRRSVCAGVEGGARHRSGGHIVQSTAVCIHDVRLYTVYTV